MAGLGGMLEQPGLSERSFDAYSDQEEEESEGEWDEQSAGMALEQWIGDADFTPEDVLCAQNRRRWKPDALAFASAELTRCLGRLRDAGSPGEIVRWRKMELFILQAFA